MPPKACRQFCASSMPLSPTNALAMLATSPASSRSSCTARAAAVRTALLASTSKLVSASRCLIAWNEPIGRPNAVRFLAYSTVSEKMWSIAPTDSATVSTTATWSWRSRIGRSLTGSPTTAARGASTASRVTRPKLRVMSSPSSLVTVRPGAVLGSSTWIGPPALPALTSSQSARCVLHQALRSRQDEAVAARGACRHAGVRPPVAGWIGERPGGRRLAGDQPRQDPRPLVVGRARRQCQGDDVAGDEGSWLQEPPPLNGHHRGVDHSLPGDAAAAVLLGDQQGEPPQLRRLAQIAGLNPTRRVLGQLPHLGQRTSRLDEPGGRVPEQLLVTGQVEVHGGT